MPKLNHKSLIITLIAAVVFLYLLSSAAVLFAQQAEPRSAETQSVNIAGNTGEIITAVKNSEIKTDGETAEIKTVETAAEAEALSETSEVEASGNTAADESVETAFIPRPLAIMVENEPPARPQSGLYAAKVLFEIQAEEVTRFMGIYYERSQKFEIGPIRSARHYFVDISTMFDAVYVHVGGSPMGLAEISDRKINNINAIKGDRGFYRSSDRRIPHNLYANLPALEREMERKKYRMQTEKAFPFELLNLKMNPEELDAKNIRCTPVKTIQIPYSRGYRVSYDYNTGENNFNRLYNNKPFKDHRGSNTVKADTVIVMRCAMRIIDSQMRHEMDLYEGGTCEIFMSGRHISGSWDRDRTNGNFKYYDADLNDVKFNPGMLIIHIIPPSQPLIVDDKTLVYEQKKSAGKSGNKKKKNAGKAESSVSEEYEEDEGIPF